MYDNEKLVYDAKQISKLLGIGMNTTYQLMNSKSFPTIRIGKKMFVSKKAFEQWLEKESLI